MADDKLEDMNLYRKNKKIKFIREKYYRNNRTKNNVGYSFQRCSYSESIEKLDVSLFNKDQFKNLFEKRFQFTTEKSLEITISIIGTYQEWCKTDLKNPIRFDVRNFTREEKETFIHKIVYISRHQIYDILDDPKINQRDKAILFMAFEGIGGREHWEISHLQLKHLKDDTIIVPGERSRMIKVPKKLINILYEANDLIERDRNVKKPNAKTTKSNLYDIGYIIKNSQNRNKPLGKQMIYNIIRDILNEYYGYPIDNSIKYVNNSGKIDWFNRITNELSIDQKNVDMDVYEKLCNRYGMNKNLCYDLEKFLLKNVNEEISYNDPEQTTIIYSILESTAKNFTNETSHLDNKNSNEEDNDNLDDEEKESPEWLKFREKLGVFGELVAKYILESKFEIVLDVRKKFRLGYDFKVYDSSQKEHLIEVKTSFKKRFFISLNELEKAYRNREKYNILFIHIDDKLKVLKSIQINNPVDFFEIEYAGITLKNIFRGCSLYANNFCIEMESSILDNSDTITLEVIEKCRIELDNLLNRSPAPKDSTQK